MTIPGGRKTKPRPLVRQPHTPMRHRQGRAYVFAQKCHSPPPTAAVGSRTPPGKASLASLTKCRPQQTASKSSLQKIVNSPFLLNSTQPLQKSEKKLYGVPVYILSTAGRAIAVTLPVRTTSTKTAARAHSTQALVAKLHRTKTRPEATASEVVDLDTRRSCEPRTSGDAASQTSRACSSLLAG